MEYLFRETQYFHLWVYLILVVVVALVLLLYLPFTIRKIGLLLILVVLFLLFLRLETFVDRQNMIIRFGWTPIVKKTIPRVEIQNVETCSYRPLKDFLGWGWRWGRGGVEAFTAKGKSGVCITLKDGRRYLIGSSRSSELARVLSWRDEESKHE